MPYRPYHHLAYALNGTASKRLVPIIVVCREREELMAIDHDDVENAFMFVNLTRMYGNQVILCKRTGRMFYISELGD